jgi:hypothetical protein
MLIGITGLKGSGKDTFATPLVWEQGFSNIKMADPIKVMLSTMYNIAGYSPQEVHRRLEGILKETPCSLLGGNTPRSVMQTLGTEWARMVDPTHTLWSRIWESRVIPLLKEGTPIVCTDIRFEHEVEVIRRLGGTMVRIVRPGQEPRDPHPSEVLMEALDVDETFYNIGSSEDLITKARLFLKELMV